MQRIRKVILAEQSDLNDATRSMVANLRELCRGLTTAERVRVWGYYAKWQAKRRQESLDAVYAATYNCEAVDVVSQRRRMKPYRFNDRLMLLPTATS